MRCRDCGCSREAHDNDGRCHGRQHLTPWDTEACMCPRFRGPKEGPPVTLKITDSKE